MDNSNCSSAAVGSEIEKSRWSTRTERHDRLCSDHFVKGEINKLLINQTKQRSTWWAGISACVVLYFITQERLVENPFFLLATKLLQRAEKRLLHKDVGLSLSSIKC